MFSHRWWGVDAIVPHFVAKLHVRLWATMAKGSQYLSNRSSNSQMPKPGCLTTLEWPPQLCIQKQRQHRETAQKWLKMA